MLRTDAIRLDFESAVVDPLTGWVEVDGTAALVGVMAYPTGPEFVPPETLAHVDGLIGLPVTVRHPGNGQELLDVDTTRREQVGTVIRASFDSETGRLRLRLRLTDRAAITALQAGTSELSPGYDATVIPRRGTYDGKDYVAVQTARAYNHIAIVDRARGGREARIDAMDTIEIDGKQYQVPPEVAAYIATLQPKAPPTEMQMQTEDAKPRTDAAPAVDVAAITAAVSAAIREDVAKAIRTDREHAAREAAVLGDTIVQCRPHLPQSYRTDGKDRGAILADTVLALKPELAPIVKASAADISRLQGLVDALTCASPDGTRTDAVDAKNVGDVDPIQAAAERQNARLHAVKGGKQ